VSWSKLLSDKRDLENLINSVNQELSRLEQAAKSASTLRDQVYVIEERKRLENRLAIAREKLGEVEAELEKLRAEVAKSKKEIQAKAERAVESAEKGFNEIFTKLNELVTLIEKYEDTEREFINSMTSARYATEILGEQLTPITKLSESVFIRLHNLRRDLIFHINELRGYL
jgi:predicted  nucleic acid-binding Zn-ribbon protein